MSFIRSTQLWSVVIGSAIITLPAGKALAVDGGPRGAVDHSERVKSDVSGRSAVEGRTHISGLASRDDVARQLESLGIGQDEAQRRIAALSDSEVQALDGKLATLPAGGDSTITIGVGAAILIALLLIIFL